MSVTFIPQTPDHTERTSLYAEQVLATEVRTSFGEACVASPSQHLSC